MSVLLTVQNLRKAFGLFVVFMAFFQLWKEFSHAS